MDDILLNFCSRFRDSDDDECVAYLNLENRNVNLNWIENDWNDNDWFGSVGKYFYLFFARDSSICLVHPPSILPISLRYAEMAVYFLLSNAFISQATLKKNLSISSLMPAFSTQDSFCLPF